MKGISYITDKENRKKAVEIEVKAIEQHEGEVHEFIDVLIAESRKDEVISWEEASLECPSPLAPVGFESILSKPIK